MQEKDGHFGTEVDKMARKRRAEARLTIDVLFLGRVPVVSQSLVGGWMGGNVTAVRVVFMRGGRAQKSDKH